MNPPPIAAPHCSAFISRAFFRAFYALVAALAFAIPVYAGQSTPDPDETIRRIDAAVHARNSGVASYSVQELYSIYRNGESTPSAQVTVKTVYTRGAGKEYTPISQSGSSILRSVIIDKVLANEKEMARAANRESIAITSANYRMHPEPGVVTLNGRQCIIVDLAARRKISYLFNGKGWFDASDFTLVHIEGSPAASPSFLAGATGGRRDYIKIDGFSMAQHAEMRSHSLLFGTTLLNIDYSDYQIQLDQAGAAANSTASTSESAPTQR